MTTRTRAIAELSMMLGLPEGEIDPNTLNSFLEDSEWYHDGHERGSCFQCKLD